MWWCVYVHCCSLLNELSRFDLAWLENPRHRIHGNIEGDNTLSPTDKRYLLGVHKRQGEGKLPSDPSTIDKQYLVDIYGRYIAGQFSGNFQEQILGGGMFVLWHLKFQERANQIQTGGKSLV